VDGWAATARRIAPESDDGPLDEGRLMVHLDFDDWAAEDVGAWWDLGDLEPAALISAWAA
jgi:hypothetical protein